jgi:hypothetical protein
MNDKFDKEIENLAKEELKEIKATHENSKSAMELKRRNRINFKMRKRELEECLDAEDAFYNAFNFRKRNRRI